MKTIGRVKTKGFGVNLSRDIGIFLKDEIRCTVMERLPGVFPDGEEDTFTDRLRFKQPMKVKEWCTQRKLNSHPQERVLEDVKSAKKFGGESCPVSHP